MSEPRGPVTETGRRWVAGWHTHVDGGEVSPINEYAVAQLTEAIVAVETESAAAARADALAEIRAGVEGLAREMIEDSGSIGQFEYGGMVHVVGYKDVLALLDSPK